MVCKSLSDPWPGEAPQHPPPPSTVSQLLPPWGWWTPRKPAGKDGINPCPLMADGHGGVEPSPHAGMGTAGTWHTSHAHHPKGFHAAPNSSFEDLSAGWLLTPTMQELFLHNVCFIYRLTLAFARGMTWALSYRFLLT